MRKDKIIKDSNNFNTNVKFCRIYLNYKGFRADEEKIDFQIFS